jgi:hypothetical protein
MQNQILKKIEETFKLQDYFNSLVNKNWVKERDLAIDWSNALLDEGAELLNSFNWKWWKDTKGNKLYSEKSKENILIEIVDMYHFLISFIIQTSKIFFSNEIEKEHPYGLLQKLNIDKNFSKDYLKYVIQLFNQKKEIKEKSDKEKFKILHKFLKEVFESLYFLEDLIEKINKEENKNLKIESFDSLIEFYSSLVNIEKEKFLEKITFKKVVELFLKLLILNGYLIEDLIKLYIGKVYLNEYRQIKGYKEGTYKKIWKNGKEDNFNMIEVLKKLNIEELNKEKLFKEFDKLY